MPWGIFGLQGFPLGSSLETEQSVMIKMKDDKNERQSTNKKGLQRTETSKFK